MKTKIADALITLQKSSDPDSSVNFSHQGINPAKSFEAEVFYSESGVPTVKLISNTGYNKKYISSKLKSDLQSVINAAIPDAGHGDFVLTRKFLNPPPHPGQLKDLSGSDYYYAINGSIISCNGQQLGNNFQGRFTRIYPAICSGGGEPANYSEFQLL